MTQSPGSPGGSGRVSPGARRRPTLRDIAQETGVSQALVSMVLAGKPGPGAATSARILEVAERLGYRTDRTASQLARSRSRSLGVLITPANQYHAELVAEIQAAAFEQGYEVLLGAVTRSHDERRAIETLVDFRCEALVLLNPRLPTDDLEAAIEGLPAVCIGRPLELPGVDVVRAADVAAMELLVEHLTALGHTRIVHIDGGRHPLATERRRGYRAAMRRRGLAALVLPGGESEEGGIAAAELMPDRCPDATAVIAYNDPCAIGVMDHLDRTGVRIPQDVSVTGFDDDRLARLRRIDLTTIHPQAVEQARLAVRSALERLDANRTERVDHVVTPSLVPRGTTGRAPQDAGRRDPGAARDGR